MSIVDLNKKKPRYAGFRDTKFVYPASIYKLFVALAVLNEVKVGRLTLNTRKIWISKKNAVDKRKEVPSDPRPLLKPGQRHSIKYLLDLMLTRSDNTAANTLIDVVTRERINRLIRRFGWRGSEVTRKFLSRDKEDPKYRKAKATVTTTRHLAEFFTLMNKCELLDATSSLTIENILGAQLDRTKIRAGLSLNALFFHKTGWFSYTNTKDKLVGVTGDCGIVSWMIAPDFSYEFVVSCIVVLPDAEGNKLLEKIGERLEELLFQGYGIT